MSGQISSPWLSQNELYYPRFANQQLAEGDQKLAQNQLLQQSTQQEIGGRDIEIGARLASSLLNMDEGQAAQAYSQALPGLQAQGYLRHAPSVYPGHEVAKRLAAMGTPSKDQYLQAQSTAAKAGMVASDGTTAGTGGKPLAPVDTGDIEPEAQTRAFAVRDGLIKRGLDPETATAFAANALHESGANPGTGAGDGGASHGLFQWRDDRRDNYVKTYGHAPDNAPLDEQLDFVMRELGGPESVAKSRILGAKGVAEKAGQVSEAYLRPKDTAAEMNRRAGTALKLAGLNAPLAPDAQAGMTDQAWLDQQAKTYPSLAGPNVNMQAGTQPPVAAPPAPSGVAARTGGVDVAGPGGTPPSTPPAAAVATPPTQLAPTQPPAVPASAAPAPQASAMPAELQTDPQSGLTARDVQQLTPLFDAARHGAIPLATLQNEVQQRVANNVARQDHWQAQQHQAMEDTRQREADARADQAAARADAKAAIEAKQAGLPYQGTGIQEQDANVLLGGDDGSARYAGAFARTAAPRTNQDGSTVIPNMQAYDKPTYRGGKGQTADAGTDAPDYSQQGKTPPLQLTQDQARAATYADRMSASHSVMSSLDNSATSWAEKNKQKAGDWVGYSFNSPDYQRVKQAQEDFVNATLRLESGAVISPDEFKKAATQYFPQPGESAAVIEQKKANREREIAGFVREAGRGYKPPETTSTPRTVKSSADYNAVPSGALYVDPDGHTRRKQ